jgi:hypothetical protein
MDLMVSKVTPATDTFWGIDDPQTDADWQVFIDARNMDAIWEAGDTLYTLNETSHIDFNPAVTEND